jgi:non-heme Fe2+,alpha-ketoglutarate-dependent halogenase
MVEAMSNQAMETTPRSYTPIAQDALGAMQRDLRFHPCTVTNPVVLTRAQIEAFNRDGFIKGIRIFDAVEIAEHRRYLDALLARVLAEGKDSYSISTAHLGYGKVYDLITHPRIVACVKDILGENVVGWGAHYFCKMPRDGKTVSWHQDASYWPMTPSKTVTVWLAIDDADTGNACMRFIPGSHHYGHLTHHLTEEAANSVLDQTVENAEEFGAPVDVELRAGEISMHTDLLLHGSRANDSDRRRCGLTLRYCTTDVRAAMGWNGKGVIVSGTDPSGHWANPARPEQD